MASGSDCVDQVGGEPRRSNCCETHAFERGLRDKAVVLGCPGPGPQQEVFSDVEAFCLRILHSGLATNGMLVNC